MSYTELIKETLNILDLNVIFEENCLRKEKINGQIKTTFPTVLHFDEFKSVRQVSGAMSFIILNGQTRKLFDIVENRQLSYLERYFNRFPLSVRENVQFIVIDIYTPYVFLVKNVSLKQSSSLIASISFNTSVGSFETIESLGQIIY